MKVVGVGSVGTRCGIALMMAASVDPVFLQIKEVRKSVLEPYASKSSTRIAGKGCHGSAHYAIGQRRFPGLVGYGSGPALLRSPVE